MTWNLINYNNLLSITLKIIVLLLLFATLTIQFILVNILLSGPNNRLQGKAMVFKLDNLNTFIKVNFLLIKNMDMDSFNLLEKIPSFIRVIFLMDLWMVMENQ
jgi:hypothetical protein